MNLLRTCIVIVVLVGAIAPAAGADSWFADTSAPAVIAGDRPGDARSIDAPISGDRPADRAVRSVVVSVAADGGADFDWVAAGVGAASAFALVGVVFAGLALGGRRWHLAVVAVVAAVAVLAPTASADAVYHTEHLPLTPVAGAPLRTGFVQNIKANGQSVYAHELFHVTGADLRARYTVTRNFFLFDTGCDDEHGTVFASLVGTVVTNAAGNGADDVLVRPEEIPAFLVGDHGVRWTVTDASGAIRYETTCTKVSLD